jgi:hypothetical protein
MGLNLFDRFTYLHFVTGALSNYWGITLRQWMIWHTIFEILENTKYGMYVINHYITFWPGGKPAPDSIINRIGDTIGALLGWVSAYYVNKF